jgi:glycosyltransferase involved in cell wall biosynthesis
MDNYDYVVTLSNDMQQEALEMFPRLQNKLIRIYNSIDLNRITIQAKEEVTDSRIHEQFILAVERLEETQKDLTSLIDAYWELTKRNIQNLPKLFIIGEGKSRSIIEEQIQKLKLEGHVILLGFIENPYPWMAKAQAIVHSSKFEGLPTVLIEALMLDKLIISSDCPTGPAEILNNGKAGILVPVGDTVGFADAIERILSDKTLQESLHAELKEHRTKFMAEENISALEQLF